MHADGVVYSSGENRAMEKSRSWPSAHDWKSCIPQKGIEGSNPSFSATKEKPGFFKNTGFSFVFCHNFMCHF